MRLTENLFLCLPFLASAGIIKHYTGKIVQGLVIDLWTSFLAATSISILSGKPLTAYRRVMTRIVGDAQFICSKLISDYHVTFKLKSM